MQQWFEQDHHTNNPTLKSREKLKKLLKPPKAMTLLKTFTVEAEAIPGQHICVSGNCLTLGNWEVSDAFVLTNTNLTHTKNK